MDSDEECTKEKRKHIVIKNSTDLQRMKLEKLMKNPDKPVVIPERPKPKGVPGVPDFVRNVMGSSAGAGSGEFHVYRHLRRKEYARQKYMQEKGERERLDEEYHNKLEEHKQMAEAKTAKKRAKRLKKKGKNKGKNKKPKLKESSPESDSESTSEEENTVKEKKGEIDITEINDYEMEEIKNEVEDKKCKGETETTLNAKQDSSKEVLLEGCNLKNNKHIIIQEINDNEIEEEKQDHKKKVEIKECEDEIQITEHSE